MSKALPSAGRLSLMCSQLQLDFVAALETLRKISETPEKFKRCPVDQMERRLAKTVEQIEGEFLKIFEKIENSFRSPSDDEFINDSSELSVTTSDSEPEYITSSDESSEDTEYCSDDDSIEILE